MWASPWKCGSEGSCGSLWSHPAPSLENVVNLKASFLDPPIGLRHIMNQQGTPKYRWHVTGWMMRQLGTIHRIQVQWLWPTFRKNATCSAINSCTQRIASVTVCLATSPSVTTQNYKSTFRLFVKRNILLMRNAVTLSKQSQVSFTIKNLIIIIIYYITA